MFVQNSCFQINVMMLTLVIFLHSNKACNIVCIPIHLFVKQGPLPLEELLKCPLKKKFAYFSEQK